MAFRPSLLPLTPPPGTRTDVGLGCAPIGNLYSAVDDTDAVRTVHAALELGVRFFDTAPHYGAGESERRLGLAIADIPRDTISIATKVGRRIVDADGRQSAVGGTGAGTVGDLSRDGVWRSVEGSLARLGTDRVDLLHLHDPEDVDEALAGAMTALVELKEQGVVRAIGVGMVRTAPLTRFAAEAPVDVIMEAGRLTLLDRSATLDLLPAAAANGVGILAAGVYNSGVLVDPHGAAFFDYYPADETTIDRARRMQAACNAAGFDLAHAAVRFAFRHDVDACIVGARTPEEVATFVVGADADIPAALWAELDAIIA